MTDAEAQATLLRERGSREVERAGVVSCGFCRRRLAEEFFFSCRRCDASYCYIHMSRHGPPGCARQVRKNERVSAVEDGHPRGDAGADGGLAPMRAGPTPGGASSANV